MKKEKQKRMKVVIVGASESGESLAKNLSLRDQDVTIVIEDEKEAKRLSREVDAAVISGKATDISILEDAGTPECDSFVACSESDELNMMVCMIAKNMHVKKILAIVNDPLNEEIFRKLDIDLIVPAVTSTKKALDILLYQRAKETILASIGRGKAEIIKLSLVKGSGLVGRIPHMKEGVICMIERGDNVILPTDKVKLKEHDLLTVATTSENIDSVISIITKK
ncbi:potassium channel family protein [Candidatus Undinarchaeota archaeon]